jgi:putative SOS response-associated peptidase YedK
MCGRSSLTKTEKQLEERFDATFYSEDLERYNPLPNYNVAPSHMHPVISNMDPDHFQAFRWGLIPFWAKDMKVGYKMINARVETIFEKNSFKKAIETQRCIVPFDGFYEWKKEADGSKTPYRIKVKDIDIFSIAGIWERWKSPEGKEIYSFTLITQDADEYMQSIHNRMPAILTPESEKLWLQNDVSVKDLVQQLVLPLQDYELEAYPVASKVGNVRNNDSSLIEPAAQKKVVKKKSNHGKDMNRHTLFD